MSDPPEDPLGESLDRPYRRMYRLLGAQFVFETASAELARVVAAAFGDLPRYRLAPRVPRLVVHLTLRAGRRSFARAGPPRPRLSSSDGLLCANVDEDNFAVVAPGAGRALLVVSHQMLRFPYQLRYELLEFVVLTLAARAQSLVAMHAGCIAQRGRALLLLGDSGSGKSTLALHAPFAGLEYVGEDSVFVEPRTLRAASLPNYMNVREDMPRRLRPVQLSRALARATPIRRRSGVRKRAMDLRTSPMNVATRAPRIVAVVFLDSRPAGVKGLLRPLAWAHARSALGRTQPYAARQPGWNAFARAAVRLPVFELRRGSHPSLAAVALRALLGDHAT